MEADSAIFRRRSWALAAGLFVLARLVWKAGTRGYSGATTCLAGPTAGGVGFDTRSVLSAELPYAPGRRAGVFGCRGPFRPNLIAMTVCPLIRVDQERGVVEVADIDALEGTAVLDIKPYYGFCDRVRSPRAASWLPDWGEWVPDGGIGLEDEEAATCLDGRGGRVDSRGA